jgi:hypothetical protein
VDVLRWPPAERALARGHGAARSGALPSGALPVGATSQGSNTSLSSLQPAALSSRFCARPGNARGVVSSDFEGPSARPRSGPTSADAAVGARNVSADMALTGPHSDALVRGSAASTSADGLFAARAAATAGAPTLHAQQQLATAAAHHLASLPSAQGPRSEKSGPRAKRISRSVDIKLFRAGSEAGGSARSAERPSMSRGVLSAGGGTRRKSEVGGRPSVAVASGGRVAMHALFDSVNASDGEDGDARVGLAELMRQGWPGEEEEDNGAGAGARGAAAGQREKRASAGAEAGVKETGGEMREGPWSTPAGPRRRGLAAFGLGNGTVCPAAFVGLVTLYVSKAVAT